MYGGYADPQMYGDSQLFPQSPPFGGSGEDMFGAPDDFDFSGLESLPNKARAID